MCSGVAKPGQARALPGHQATLPYHQLLRVIKRRGLDPVTLQHMQLYVVSTTYETLTRANFSLHFNSWATDNKYVFSLQVLAHACFDCGSNNRRQ